VKIGKLTNEELRELVFAHLPRLSERTMIGANIGADCAWIDLEDRILVASSDPITAGGIQSGTLAIHVSCNDIAASGIMPAGILVVLLAPVDVTREEIIRVVKQASEAAQELGVDIVGGHTEITGAVNTFVVTSTAFGLISRNEPFISGKARPGDTLLMTKTAAIEGTWIISMNHTDRIKDMVSIGIIEQAQDFIRSISVVKEGSALGKLTVQAGEIPDSLFHDPNNRFQRLPAVHLMHDSTEGGILGAVYEMAEFSGIGVTVNTEAIPIHPSTRAICNALSIDPLRLISSGSLLIATPYPDLVINTLNELSVLCTRIGIFTETGFSRVESDGRLLPLDPPCRDEIYLL